MKAMRKHLRHKEKVAKRVASGHWKVRGIMDDQVKKILGRGFGEGDLTDDQVKEILRKWHRRGDGEGDTGDCSAPTLGSGRLAERRRTSAVSTTSGGGSSWFGGSNIHHNTSLLSVYSEGEEEYGESLSYGVSLTQSGTTSITIE